MKKIMLAVLGVAMVPLSHAADPGNTRMLSSPAVHGQNLAFVYDNDIWLTSLAGGSARRLTQAPGRESALRFSPDGQWLAFSANYGDNTDVYVMPAQGGEARRLTWHPGRDVVVGFTPDGRVLFHSERGRFVPQTAQLYSVAVKGGVPERLPVPFGTKAALSADGRTLAYLPNREVFRQWKNYRGGTQSRLWLMNMSDYSVKELEKPAGGSNDTDPMWVNGALYFSSDRNGEFNLYRQDASGITQLTQLKDFPVTDPSTDGSGVIVFEHGGYIHRLNTADSTVQQIRISALSDLIETRPRLASDPKWVREAAASPDLKRMAFNYRGEIVTVPAEKGDARQLTRSTGANDHSPAWSADGKQIAWFSDGSGEYELLLADQDGKGQPRRYKLAGAGFYDRPLFSPDGTRIAYRDNSQSLWVTELTTGKNIKIASEPVYTPLNLMRANWSPDSRWLAYTVQAAGLIQTVNVWSAESGRSIQVTDGLSEMAEPVFDPNGEFLYVLASTDAGPLKDWFSQINIDSPVRYGLYAITLRQDGPSAAPPQSDEVTVSTAPEPKDTAKEAAAKDSKAKGADKPPVVRIDAVGIEDRIVALPVGVGARHDLRVGASGEIYFIEGSGATAQEALSTPGELKRFTLEKREVKTLARGVDDFLLARDGKRIGYHVGADWFVTDVADELPPGKGKLALNTVSVAVNPRVEWAQILDEAWRINRDFFYADNFHGANWPAMREKYRAFLPDLATRTDLERVIEMMLSELAVGHSFQTPGDSPFKPAKVAVGLLGADYAIERDRYRFNKILGGLNWNPDLRSPLRAPGVYVKSGEYLLAVDGMDLRAPTSVYSLFENRVDRQVRITVGPSADGKNSRDVIVVPIADETSLRYMDWVEGNIRYVSEKSGGRLAYVHVPDTANGGHTMFKRYFYPQSQRAGIVLDERYNRGGQIADYYIDILRRPPISHWKMRYGEDLSSPRGSIQGPKVLLADENAGSGGDLLPWMFRHFELGPIVGKRTWGGLVGILGYPPLMDGGGITSPNLAFWTEKGYGVENEGVAPDVEVEQWPRDVNAGRDPQLDRAIQIALDALAKNPPTPAKAPPLPVRVK
ncbi:S41 family peptidase [Steroidobacter sp.]|uniref:S41 family peptidase n=1 Tax=Steroidobacter sp. TaxID=1978227 RepID=UPI001A6124D4|nr:S41 family peptidase [Steroidobacter sp.]MBL8270455.1 PD40 domain-containing protein [Steroidobacter sp.]